MTLGRLEVHVRDASGGPLPGEAVSVSTQKLDVNGRPVPRDTVTFRRTDSSGILTLDLTEGNYALKVGNGPTMLDIPVKSGMLTVWDRGKVEVFPGSGR